MDLLRYDEGVEEGRLSVEEEDWPMESTAESEDMSMEIDEDALTLGFSVTC